MLKKILRERINAAPPEMSVSAVLRELESGAVVFEFNPNCQMKSASTIKVLIMAEAMRQLEAKTLNPHRHIIIPDAARLEDSVVGLLEVESLTLHDLVTMMIIVSDNTCTNVLIDLLGMDRVNSFGQVLGLRQTVLARKMLDFQAAAAGRENLTSAADLASLFFMIGRRKLPASAQMLDILYHQKQGAFRRSLPEEIRIAHKPGGLSDIAHDAGIIRAGTADYVWCVTTSGAPNAAGCELIGDLTKLLYDNLNNQ
ncbi:MAG: class A beta-lactamase-related serine hydrolase [Victivallaceae bacterium]|nr:class A beta-lactamase-related serine hydrolase [Victivallaceae bacterium]